MNEIERDKDGNQIVRVGTVHEKETALPVTAVRHTTDAVLTAEVTEPVGLTDEVTYKITRETETETDYIDVRVYHGQILEIVAHTSDGEQIFHDIEDRLAEGGWTSVQTMENLLEFLIRQIEGL